MPNVPANPRLTRILLVEDNFAHAELIRRTLALAQAQAEITHVADGEAAIDFLHRQGAYTHLIAAPLPQLILLDLRLPKCDGFDVLRAVRANPALTRIPIIVLSSSAAEHDIGQAYALRANSYLIKPFSFSDFTTLMGSLTTYWLYWNTFPQD